jgi:hypothetical protein
VAFEGWHAASFERSLDIFKNGQPREKREALKTIDNVGLFTGDRLAMPKNATCRRWREASQHA